MDEVLHAGRAAVAVAVAVLMLAVGACSDDRGSAEELCDLLGDGRSFSALFEQGFDPTDTDRAVAQLQAAEVDLRQLQDAAPSDLHDELDHERRYVEAVLEILKRVDPDDPAAVVAAINGLTEQRQAVEVASVELQAFERDHCR